MILPNYGKVAGLPDPFVDAAPGFFNFLLRERGLRETPKRKPSKAGRAAIVAALKKRWAAKKAAAKKIV